MSRDDAAEAVNASIHPKVAERLFDSRTVLIHGEITSRVARDITAQLLALAAESDDDITIFIHSEGGHVEAGDAIHDMISFVKPRIVMIGTGWVASAAVHIFLAAPKADRYCLPNTRFLIHQPLGGAGGAQRAARLRTNDVGQGDGSLQLIVDENVHDRFPFRRKLLHTTVGDGNVLFF